MKQWVEMILYRGFVSKDFKVRYMYCNDDESEFKTVVVTDRGGVKLRPSFMIKIEEGFDKPSMIINANRYYPFISLMEKSIKLISENFTDLFPNVGRIEFEIDSKMLDIFQTEKAISTCGMTIVPAVWVDPEGTCKPGLRVIDNKGSMIMPFEDAMAIPSLLRGIDPFNLGLNILSHCK